MVLPPRRVPVLRAFTFGRCAFESPLTRIAPDSEIHFALLLSIAAAPPEGVSRDELIARVWPRAEGEEGRHRLRQAMYRLRQLTVPVHLRAGHVSFDWAETALDLHLLLHGTPRRETLVELGALPFLPSYAPTLGEPFGHWLESLRARVATRLRRALADEVTSARSRGRFHEMGQVARALLSLDPLNEIGTMGLAEALALEGSKVEALRLLEDYEDEVGAINANLQLPVRVLRRRVAEVLDDSLVLRRFELPFVGREREFGELRQLLREVRTGQSRAAILTGEAGIGKSRLAGEMLRLAALDGVTLATYTTSAGDSFTPISTLVSVGQLLLTLPGALGCAQEHLAYVRRLGTPETVTAWSVTGMAADILYAQLVQALAELVSAIAEEAPLILFLDDAERLHPTTWRVVMDVWDRVGDRSVCFLFAARRLPSCYGSLGPRSCERLTQHIRLFPFRREESLEFVQRWAEKNHVPVDHESADRFAATSQGNPFYLSELAAHLGRGGDQQETPPSIRELVAAQHAALTKGAQRVLLVIAIFEARATTARVTQVLEIPAADFMAALDELEDAGLVATNGPAVWCRHRMVGQISASLGMPSIVAFVHGRAAELLEREADATNSVELLGDCVTHWERAGETRRAYEAAMKLGHRLVGMGMGEEAMRAYESARRCSQSDEELLPAIEGGITASRLSADWEGVRRLCDERIPVRDRIRAPESATDEFELYAVEANMLLFERNTWLDRLLTLAGCANGEMGFRVRAATMAAMLGDNNYDEVAVRDSHASVADLLDSLESQDQDATLYSLVYHTSVGDPHLVQPLALRYARISRESTEKRQQLHGLRRAANALVRVGEHELARPMLEETIDLAKKLKLPKQVFSSSDVLLTSYLLCGELTLADSEVVRQREIVRVDGTAIMRAMLRYSSSVVAWLTEDRALARSLWSEYRKDVRFSQAASDYCASLGEVALQLLIAPTSIDRSELSRLRKLHLRGRALGRQDINTAILCAALRTVGEEKVSLKFEREYRLHRREVTRGLFDTLRPTETNRRKG